MRGWRHICRCSLINPRHLRAHFQNALRWFRLGYCCLVQAISVALLLPPFGVCFVSLMGLIGPLFQTHVVRPVGLTILRFSYFLYFLYFFYPSFILGRGAAESHRSRSHRWGCQITFLIRKPFPMRFYWRPKSFRSISLCCPCVGTRHLVRPLNKSNSPPQSMSVKTPKALSGDSG